MALNPQQLQALFQAEASGNQAGFAGATPGMSQDERNQYINQYGTGGTGYGDFLKWYGGGRQVPGAGTTGPSTGASMTSGSNFAGPQNPAMPAYQQQVSNGGPGAQATPGASGTATTQPVQPNNPYAKIGNQGPMSMGGMGPGYGNQQAAMMRRSMYGLMGYGGGNPYSRMFGGGYGGGMGMSPYQNFRQQIYGGGAGSTQGSSPYSGGQRMAQPYNYAINPLMYQGFNR